MVTPSKIKTLRDYFTLTDNEIICDICFNSYDIIINNEDVRKHLNDTHKEYENAVSSKSTQGDMKKFYTIHNNTIKCKHCEKLYISWNTHSIIKFHLGGGHVTDEDKVNKICELIREKYKLNESDGKQYCNNCQMDIQNKPAYLINHLFLDHYNEVNLQYKPSNIRKWNNLDELFNNWIWNYYVRNGEYAHCSVCKEKDYKYLHKAHQAYHMKQHMRENHSNVEYVPLKAFKKSNFSVIQDTLLYCDLCGKTVETSCYIHSHLQDHLSDKHLIHSDDAEITRGWVFKHIDILPGFQKYHCKHCKKMLRKMCSFSLYEHLTKDHGLKMSFEISPMKESSNSDSLSSSDNNVKDIGTSSGEPQAGSSKDLDTDDRDSGMKKLKYDDDNRQ